MTSRQLLCCEEKAFFYCAGEDDIPSRHCTCLVFTLKLHTSAWPCSTMRPLWSQWRNFQKAGLTSGLWLALLWFSAIVHTSSSVEVHLLEDVQFSQHMTDLHGSQGRMQTVGEQISAKRANKTERSGAAGVFCEAESPEEYTNPRKKTEVESSPPDRACFSRLWIHVSLVSLPP